MRSVLEMWNECSACWRLRPTQQPWWRLRTVILEETHYTKRFQHYKPTWSLSGSWWQPVQRQQQLETSGVCRPSIGQLSAGMLMQCGCCSQLCRRQPW